MQRIIAVLLLLMATACEKKEPQKEQSPAKVILGTVASRNVPYVIRTVGNTSPFEMVDIRPQVSGELTGYYFTDGSLVKRGDLLFTIDPSAYQASLQQAEGQHQQAEALLVYNTDRVDRYKGLLPEDYVSQLNFAQYVSGKGTAAGQVTQSEGQIASAKVNLGYCTICAPWTGICGKHNYDPGNVVDPNEKTPLVTINRIQPIYALFNVAERFFVEIEKYQKLSPDGLTVEICIPGEEEKTFLGTLDFINNTIDTATGTLLLRGIFSNEDLFIWPGQFVRVSIHLYEIPNALLVPEEAIRLDTKGPYLFVATSDGTVEQRRLTLGQRFQGEQVVLKGVNEGEKVVTKGQRSLYPGAKYAVTKEASTEKTTSSAS